MHPSDTAVTAEPDRVDLLLAYAGYGLIALALALTAAVVALTVSGGVPAGLEVGSLVFVALTAVVVLAAARFGRRRSRPDVGFRRQ